MRAKSQSPWHWYPYINCAINSFYLEITWCQLLNLLRYSLNLRVYAWAYSRSSFRKGSIHIYSSANTESQGIRQSFNLDTSTMDYLRIKYLKITDQNFEVFLGQIQPSKLVSCLSKDKSKQRSCKISYRIQRKLK